MELCGDIGDVTIQNHSDQSIFLTDVLDVPESGSINAEVTSKF